jgi:hypothetical protein
MDLHLARALLSAWQLPQFRDALQHLIDLDEVTSLLAAYAAGAPDEQTQHRLLELLRSASDTDAIRDAVLLLVADDAFRQEISAAVGNAMPERPGLVHAIASPDVARDVIHILRSDRMRASLWKAVDSQLAGRRLRLYAAGLALLVHRDVRRLLRELRRLGVLRELRR